MKPNGMLSSRQRRALDALETEPTKRAAAKKAGIGVTTLWRYLKQPAFQDALRERREAARLHALANLAAKYGLALGVYDDLLDSEDTTDAIRLRAANAIIEKGETMRASLDLEQRLLDLERRVLS